VPFPIEWRQEEKAACGPIELRAEQIALIEKANPSYRERHVESLKGESMRKTMGAGTSNEEPSET